MKQGLLLWNPPRDSFSPPLPLSLLLPITRTRRIAVVAATTEPVNGEQLTARERRRLKNERRQSNAYNWREEVEERLLKKPKKRYVSWTEELNLDKLALLGPQWWIFRVSRVSGLYTAEALARSLARDFPHLEFKVYDAAVHVKKKLKDGSYSIKPKQLFPGSIFLRCTLNKEIHDFIREFDGVGGFVGSKVGNSIRRINKPKPVSVDDMEAVFQKVREEQEKNDQAFKEEQHVEGALNPEMLDIDSHVDSSDDAEPVIDFKPKRRTRKASEAFAGNSSTGKDDKLLFKGSTVRVVSGTFAEFVGSLKKINRRTGKEEEKCLLTGNCSIYAVWERDTSRSRCQ
ncbi:uncharacterized protein LOC131168377 isoform X2 [Malania oleifera]|uniref:uncharacterized protein LOC131168377 isoform X2 n=1 Tax=Malania oleifera TaxID=397392 RepID=UPI0025ADBD2F|nr:uncharacterized protein LOC131168377 isoform X2 [Malania oleifera]